MRIDVHIERTEKLLTQREYVLSIDEVSIRKLDPSNDNRAEIKAVIHFLDGSTLHFMELVETGKCYPQVLKYSYQYIDTGAQRFRYDNTPHHKGLPTYPHHKHIGSGKQEKIVSSYHPNYDNLFLEISEIIESKDVDSENVPK